jgi:hypothetical protein
LTAPATAPQPMERPTISAAELRLPVRGWFTAMDIWRATGERLQPMAIRRALRKLVADGALLTEIAGQTRRYRKVGI